MNNAMIRKRDLLRFGSALSLAALGLAADAVIRSPSAVADAFEPGCRKPADQCHPVGRNSG